MIQSIRAILVVAITATILAVIRPGDLDMMVIPVLVEGLKVLIPELMVFAVAFKSPIRAKVLRRDIEGSVPAYTLNVLVAWMITTAVIECIWPGAQKAAGASWFMAYMAAHVLAAYLIPIIERRLARRAA